MRGNMQPARGLATRRFWGVARGLALVWIGPALIYNVDWTGHGSWQANAAAVIMILGSALFIEGAHRLRSLVLSPILVVAALFLVYVNTKQAMRTISGDREAASEAKLEKIAGGSHLASQRVALGRRVDAQVKIAGWDAVGALEAVYATVTSSDPRTWAATSQCEDVTATKSGTFCGRVATAKAKVEAARERDRLQAQLDALPVPTGIVAVNQKTEVGRRWLHRQHHGAAHRGRLQAHRAAGESRGGIVAGGGLRAAGGARPDLLVGLRQHDGVRRRLRLRRGGARAQGGRQAGETHYY
jgi:hypothetical protein